MDRRRAIDLVFSTWQAVESEFGPSPEGEEADDVIRALGVTDTEMGID